MYIGILNTNTLPNTDIHYILTNSSDEVLAEGILSETTNGYIEFTADANIYRIHSESSSSNSNTQYKLYLYIDESSTLPVSSQTFNATIGVKAV